MFNEEGGETITGQKYCKGCRRAAGMDGVDGGVISLGSHWMVNHYSNEKERFLGWLVVQPIQHRMRMSELTLEELKDFGIMAQTLEDALVTTYNASHLEDRIEIVYLVRLGESTLGERAEWHLHWHLVPRTSSMRHKCEGWEIVKCRERGLKPEPSKSEIEEQMKHLRQVLKVNRPLH
jgi:diadenosine tetraphosphate (Ap4A) HIT family hydrolase